ALLGDDPAASRPAPQPPRAWRAPVGALATLTRGSSATSLLTPLSSGFRLVTAEVDLEALRATARRAGATINDLLLLAASEALRAAAAGRGERLRRVVVSVPTTTSPADGPSRNRVGGFLACVPERRDGETDTQLLGRIAARTRRRKRLARAPFGSTALSATLTALGRLGWYRPLFERQRAITTLVSNLRGPEQPLVVLGTRVRSLTPISPILGNVTVVFAAASYAGRLRVTARLDRAVWDVQDALAEALRSALERLASGD
ncbi:MAG: WS/DGAT domain-containing protein, partial [Micropruina sp.]|uniref:WS/DGAT domain-containing protein n=1 Tax=Micropruina sp. TaxID=2737536 RepID=UPI0039E53CC5